MAQSSPSAAAAVAPPQVRSTTASSTRGFAASTAAFVIWGLFPIYLFGLRHIPALEITAHRVGWSLLFLLAWMGFRGELGNLTAAIARPGVLARLAATSALITVNWLAFVYAINQGHVLDVSLGYYINPLLNVVLGIVVLSERLNRVQWIAVTLAAAGVTYLIVDTGHIPWVAFTVAISFGLYGLVRKTARVDALPGLTIEMIMLAPFAVGYVIWLGATGTGAFLQTGLSADVLLVVSGMITAVPLFLFSYGARQLPYSTLGVLQYIAPSLQLVCALLVFKEPFEHGRFVGFVFIWAALAVYAGDGLWRAHRQRLVAA
jgi:chloramphenicol-sensitive protein RarD